MPPDLKFYEMRENEMISELVGLTSDLSAWNRILCTFNTFIFMGLEVTF